MKLQLLHRGSVAPSPGAGGGQARRGSPRPGARRSGSGSSDDDGEPRDSANLTELEIRDQEGVGGGGGGDVAAWVGQGVLGHATLRAADEDTSPRMNEAAEGEEGSRPSVRLMIPPGPAADLDLDSANCSDGSHPALSRHNSSQRAAAPGSPAVAGLLQGRQSTDNGGGGGGGNNGGGGGSGNGGGGGRGNNGGGGGSGNGGGGGSGNSSRLRNVAGPLGEGTNDGGGSSGGRSRLRNVAGPLGEGTNTEGGNSGRQSSRLRNVSGPLGEASLDSPREGEPAPPQPQQQPRPPSSSTVPRVGGTPRRSSTEWRPIPDPSAAPPHPSSSSSWPQPADNDDPLADLMHFPSGERAARSQKDGAGGIRNSIGGVGGKDHLDAMLVEAQLAVAGRRGSTHAAGAKGAAAAAGVGLDPLEQAAVGLGVSSPRPPPRGDASVASSRPGGAASLRHNAPAVGSDALDAALSDFARPPAFGRGSTYSRASMARAAEGAEAAGRGGGSATPETQSSPLMTQAPSAADVLPLSHRQMQGVAAEGSPRLRPAPPPVERRPLHPGGREEEERPVSMLELAAEHRTGGQGPLPERAFATPVPPSEPRPVHTDGGTGSPAIQEEAEKAFATPSPAIVPALNMDPVRAQSVREEAPAKQSTAIASSAPHSDDVHGSTSSTVPHPFIQQQRRDSQLVQGSTGGTLLLVEAQSMARESRDRAAAAGAKPGDGGGVRRFSVLMGDEDVVEGEGGAARALSMQGSASFATSQELIDSLAEKEAEKKAMNKFLLLHGRGVGGGGREDGSVKSLERVLEKSLLDRNKGWRCWGY